ncbi:MAG: GNAT family N-acetyltransferase [Chloroflexota bacterium]
MKLYFRSFRTDDIEAIVKLSLLAWEPVFVSFEQVLGKAIYSHIFPDWKSTQEEVVRKYCTKEGAIVLVAESDAQVAGFLSYELNQEEKTGETTLLAVHPDFQNRGIGTKLNNQALQEMAEHGMKLAVVGTGGDPGHSPARACYEKSGYRPLPNIRYYKHLG